MSNIGNGSEWPFTEFDGRARNPTAGQGNLAEPLLVDLLSYWRLEETGLATRVDTTGSNDLTPDASINNEAGVIGNGQNFTGSQRLTGAATPADINFDGSIDFTIAGWFHIDTIPQSVNYSLVSKWNTDTNKRGYLIFWRSSAERLQYNLSSDGAAGNTTVQSIVALTSGSNAFFVVTYDSSTGDMTVSVNTETRVSANHGTTIFTHDYPFNIGHGRFNGLNNLFDGLLDEIAIWGRKLSVNEEVQLYNSGAGFDLNSLL